MGISLVRVEVDAWFALVGPEASRGWASPIDLADYLKAGNFAGAGAAVGENAPLVICEAALNAVAKRKAQSEGPSAAQGLTTDVSDAEIISEEEMPAKKDVH
jgi:hypothetical protein